MRSTEIERKVKKEKLKLSFAYTFITLIIVSILMILFYAIYSNNVYRSFDANIMQRAVSIATYLSQNEELSKEAIDSLKSQAFHLQNNNEVIEITDNTHKIILLISSINKPTISIIPNSFSFGTYIEEDNNKLILKKIRAYTSPVNNTPYYVTVGATYEEVNDSLKNVIISFLLIIPIITLITGVASYKLANIAINPIKESYEELKRFTEDASHELKTPLAAIKANIDVALLKDSKDVSYYKEKLNVINDSVNRMQNIITSMLQISRIDSGNYLFKKEKINLNSLFEEIKLKFSDAALKKNITLDIEKKDVYIETNKEALTEILEIIVENAIVFNKQYGKVKIFTDVRDKNTVINVEDTGIGISKEDLPHIFDRFYRGEKSRSRETGGAGLGLSIAYNLAKAIGAKIEVQSEEGVGSTFSIII